jgi:hypothetical protein
MKVTVDGEVRVPVRFLVGVAPYNSGEIAGFTEQDAADLVIKGCAVYEDPADAPAPVEAEASPKEKSKKGKEKGAD